MRPLTSAEHSVLDVVRELLGDVATLHVGETAANVQRSNMDAVKELTEFLSTHGIHDYSRQQIGEVNKVTAGEAILFDGRTTELSPVSFNRPVSRSRNRFWIPALKRMCQPDDVLAFAEDSGLLIVVNLSGVARHDPQLSELKSLLEGTAATPASSARAAAESDEGVPSLVGREPSAAERAAMEAYSRRLATEYFESEGWAVTATVGSVPYDLLGHKDGAELFIEVKSSKGPADAVTLTQGEVVHARKALASALFIVSNLTVKNDDGMIQVSGGSRRFVLPWVPADDALAPLDFRYVVPTAVPLD